MKGVKNFGEIICDICGASIIKRTAKQARCNGTCTDKYHTNIERQRREALGMTKSQYREHRRMLRKSNTPTLDDDTSPEETTPIWPVPRSWPSNFMPHHRIAIIVKAND